MPLPVTTASPIGPGTGTAVWVGFPCLPVGTRSPSGLVSGFCAAIKFTAKIKKRKRDATLIFPWGSFIFCDLIFVWLCCVCQIEMNRGSRDKWVLFFLYRKSSSMNWSFIFLAQHRRPGSRLSVGAGYIHDIGFGKDGRKNFGMRKWEIRSKENGRD